MQRTSFLLVLLAVLCAAPAALSDTLYLKNGQKFEGKVVKETATHVHFKITGLGEQAFKKSDVLKVEEGATVFDEYEKRRKALAKDDAEGHFELGLWCEENSLRKDAKREFLAAVAANPDHEGAREKLDYVRYEGEWMPRDKRDAILAEIAKNEAAIVAGLALTDAHKDEKARFSVASPKAFEKAAEEGVSVTFEGPTLDRAAVLIGVVRGEPVDSLDDFIEAIEDGLKLEFDDLRRSGDPLDAKLAANNGKLLSFAYSKDELTTERRVLAIAAPAGTYQLWLECREGTFDRLRPFFDKAAASMTLLDKPLDYKNEEHGYGLAFPDDTYKALPDLPIQIQDNPVKLPPGSAVFMSNSVCFLIMPGKTGDGFADATSLETLKGSISSLYPVPNFVSTTGEAKKTTIAGEEALTGDIAMLGGQFGNGKWAVFKKGDRYFRCIFMNLGRQMGDRYVKEDFNKFMADLKVF